MSDKEPNKLRTMPMGMPPAAAINPIQSVGIFERAPNRPKVTLPPCPLKAYPEGNYLFWTSLFPIRLNSLFPIRLNSPFIGLQMLLLRLTECY